MLKIGSKSNLDTEYVCKISLLDDTEMTCEFRVSKSFAPTTTLP
jgi:hypothetical protein